MANDDSKAAQYSDTTRAVLDLALDRLTTQLPEGALPKLRKLTEAGKLEDPDTVLAALAELKKEEANAKDQGDRDPGSAGDQKPDYP